MACTPTTISMMPGVLAIATLATGALLSFLHGRALDAKVEETFEEHMAKARAKAQAREAAPPTKPKPRVVTRMKDLKRLEALLAAPGRHLTATDRQLVLSAKEATVAFEAGADGAIVATLMKGDGKLASRLVQEAQARYVEGVREETAARVEAQSPRAGWQVAARKRARDGSIAITLEKARARKPVAIG